MNGRTAPLPPRYVSWVLTCAAAVVLGCGGPQVVPPPPDLPPISASWGHLLQQVPDAAGGLFVASLDAAAEREVTALLSSLDALSGVSDLLSDVLGVDLASSAAFDALGLRRGGGMAYFLFRDAWVGIIDLEQTDALRGVLERFQSRNPDLRSLWRETDVGDVFTVWWFSGEVEQPRFHALLTDDQLVAVYDVAATPALPMVDALIESVALSSWPRPAYFSPRLAEALDRFGGDTWALAFFNTAGLVRQLAAFSAPDASPGVFGPPPPPERCRQVSDEVAETIPYLLLGTTREPADGGASERERQRLHLAVAQGRREQARTLLAPVALDPELLRQNAIVGGFAQVDADSLVQLFGDTGDAASCAGIAMLPGLLGWAADILEYFPDLRDNVDGLIGGALFDVRDTGGVPFADLFLIVGSPDPLQLSLLAQEALESGLGSHGTPAEVAGLPAIHYRVGLLFRLGLYQGAQALGVSLGRVDESWIGAVMGQATAQNEVFLDLFLDGARLDEVLGMVVDLSMVGMDDPEIRAAQEAVFEETRAELRRLQSLHVTGRYREGWIIVESEAVRRLQ